MDLDQRVAELERRATRYRNALLLMVVGVCAVAVIGATTDDGVIRGRYLFLQNEQGEVVVRAGTNSSGNGLLTVSSKTGASLINAGTSNDGTGFYLKASTRPAREWFSYPLTTTETVWLVPTTARARAGR